MNLHNLKFHLIYFLRGEKVFEAYEELKETALQSVEAVTEYKEKKLENLLAFASTHIPFYRSSQTLRKHDDLPILDKNEFRSNIKAFIAEKTKVSWRSTSGTTGSPFIFPKDRKGTAYMDAMMYLAYDWYGIQPGDKQARLWGRPLKKKDKLLQSFKDLILNRKRLSAFEMNDESCKEYYRRLKQFKPKYFYAYSNALCQFAALLEKNNLDGTLLNIKIAICTGEVLFQHQREKISRVFGCRVVNEYGSTENGIIGFECEFGRMHVMPTVALEIIDKDEDNCGQIVVTELNSRSIPFIRYKNGDKGRILSEQCSCRRPYEIMEIHEGRVDDYIRCPDGRLVYDAILAYTLKEYALQFKAYQDSLTNLRICLIPNGSFDRVCELNLRKTLQKYIGEEISIEILQVKEIPREKSGKFRYFVSNLNKSIEPAPVVPS